MSNQPIQTQTLDCILETLILKSKVYEELGIHKTSLFYKEKAFSLIKFFNSKEEIRFSFTISDFSSYNSQPVVYSALLYSKFIPFFIKTIFLQAYTLLSSNSYLRCIDLIKNNNLSHYSLEFQSLLFNAYMKIQDYQSIIDSSNINPTHEKEIYMSENNSKCTINHIYNHIDSNKRNISLTTIHNLLKSAKLFYIAKAYLKKSKLLGYSIDYFKKSLQLDPYNYYIVYLVSSKYYLSSKEIYNLVTSLSFEKDETFMKDYYLSMITSESIFLSEESDFLIEMRRNELFYNESEGFIKKINLIETLHHCGDTELLYLEASKYYYKKNYKKAVEVLLRITIQDFFWKNHIVLLGSCYFHCSSSDELFKLINKVLTYYPDSPLLYFLFGLYFILINKHELAKNSFLKSESIPESFTYLGNLYSFMYDSENAFETYRKGITSHPGNYYCLLYMGIEYAKVNQTNKSIEYMMEALKINDSNPFLYNEIGFLYYNLNEYDKAISFINKGLYICDTELKEEYYSLLLNKANTLRKLNMINDALVLFNEVLEFKNESFEALSSIGFIYYIKKEYMIAVDYLHRANFINSKNDGIRKLIDKCLGESVAVSGEGS